MSVKINLIKVNQLENVGGFVKDQATRCTRFIA